MSWFEDQITERRKADESILEESFQSIAGAILGEQVARMLGDEMIVTRRAIDEILKYYHFKPVEVPDNVRDPREQLDYCLKFHGMMKREVELSDDWYRYAYGPMLGFLKGSKTPVALLPRAVTGYYYKDLKSGKIVKINAKTAAGLEKEAICFYRPLPMKKLGISDLLIYMKQCVNLSDAVCMVLAAFAVSLIGIFIPRITAVLTGPVLASESMGALVSAGISLLCIAFSMQVFKGISLHLSRRIEIKTSVGVEASLMMRLLSLPVSFFRKYSPGELHNRMMTVDELCSMIVTETVNTGLTALMSLLYVTQIATFAPTLALPSLVVILLTVAVSVITTVMQVKISRKRMEYAAEESGMSYSMITGVQKIKLAGAEKRVFARWLAHYSHEAQLMYNPPMFLKVNSAITVAISLISTIVLYYLAVATGVSQSAFFAFSSAYGSVMAAFTMMAGIAATAAHIRPVLEMVKPVMEAVPEMSKERTIVTRVSGNVELDHVSFRYGIDMPYVINDLSLKIRSGEYVAIVGKTGCGKSTLIRLLLGFETAEKGTVFYDGRNINNLDLGSLRRHIGTVTQDGGLFQGDIYSNIVITNPFLTLDDAWEAAEIAGIADDINEMPMGMHTVISEGQGGISGGQKQRIMIARAIAPKPKLLIFDEATSALDNNTQKQVSDALDKMGCTRIVVAHRLSTIKHCDRIVVIDEGRIIEDGTYDELIEQNGVFAELVNRQRLD